MVQFDKTMKRIKRYRLDDMFRFHEDFRRILPDVRMQDMKNGLMCVINRYVTIDICVLSKELKRIYPEEWEYLSIEEIIEKHYGHEAVEFINKVI